MRTERPHRRQEGALLIELAFVLPMFFLLVFAVLELARALYMLNMLQEVTRRAAGSAAVADFSDTTTMDAIRRTAVLDPAAGRLPLGAPITEAHVRIDYLSITRDASGLMTYQVMPAGNLPASPAHNHVNCVQNPYGEQCIRLVRARICDPDNTGACDAVQYRPAFLFFNFSFSLSRSTTIVVAETLGLLPGAAP